MTQLNPYLHPQIAALLQETDMLLISSEDHDGPVHVLVPEIMRENAQKFLKVFKELGINGTVHYAHKASRSTALVKCAHSLGLSIDVASKNELVSALVQGFNGADISCTGPKDNKFLKRAVETGCLIAIDSLSELHRLTDVLSPEHKVNILIRLNDLAPADRKLQLKPSRFGLSKQQLSQVYDFLHANPRITFVGFHYHHDGYDSIAKAEFVKDMLSTIHEAYKQGFSPTILNIGGSFRAQTLAEPKAWQGYVDQLCERVRLDQPTDVWGTDPYGLKMNESRKLIGREKLLSLSSNEQPDSFLHAVLNSDFSADQSLAEVIGDNIFTVMIEPGYSLIYNCGVSIFTVTEVKDAGNNNFFIVLNGNMFHLASRMFEPVNDPILIPRHQATTAEFSGYLVGNLCREDDFLMKRKINFSQKPQSGDLVIFANTAAYSSDFEETMSIQQPRGTKLIATQSTHSWKIMTEDEYISHLER